MGYANYDRLDTDQCDWVLARTGSELFSVTKKLLNEKKIDGDTMKQMNALWLNEHNVPGAWYKYGKESFKPERLAIG